MYAAVIEAKYTARTAGAADGGFRWDRDSVNERSVLSQADAELTVKNFDRIIIPVRPVSLHYDPSAFADDTLTVELDGNSLLKQVSLTADDKSAGFIFKLAELALKSVKVAAGLPSSTASISAAGLVTRTITTIIDPLIIGATPLMGGAILVEVLPVPGAAPVAAGLVPDACANQICYPLLAPRLIRFTGPSGVREERVVVVPDPDRLARLDLKRASFVKKTVTADFKDGVLSKVTLTKPSEAMAAVQAPIDVLAAIISLPTELIQLKIDTSTKETGLAQQQLKELEAQRALLEALKKQAAEDNDPPE